MKKFPWRILLYTVFLLYLALDLKVCRGPLSQALTKRNDATRAAAEEHRWVAIVNQEPITGAQLEVAVFRHLYQRGKFPGEIPEQNLGMIRRAVLQGLIHDTLVRQYADGEGYEASPEEIDAFVTSWKSQFRSEEEWQKRAEAVGIAPDDVERELGRIWSRKRWLEQRVAPGVAVTNEEVRQWFDDNAESGEGFVEPEKIRARQIFLSTVMEDSDTREQLILEIHRQLVEEEETFETLAATHSEDERTKNSGGELNWFARDRLPDDFTEVVFAMEPGALSPPFRTGIGWHVVEVLERRPERPLEFSEVAPEIRAHLENQRTTETIEVLMEKLRTVANIRLFPEHF